MRSRVRLGFAGLLVPAILLAAALTAVSGVSPGPAQAACDSITLGGKPFVFYKRGISCSKAKRLARQTYRRNAPPPGWSCPDASPGNNRRDGANCFKVGNRSKSYGYHVFD
jgi:hypothetical protein